MMYELYQKIDQDLVHCFHVKTTGRLALEEMEIVKAVLAEGFCLDTISEHCGFPEGSLVVEIGTRPNYITPFSDHIVDILNLCGVKNVIRVERSRLYLVPTGRSAESIASQQQDRATECIYAHPVTLEPDFTEASLPMIDLLGEGPGGLVKDWLKDLGIDLAEDDRRFYHDYFVGRHRRNPTLSEMLDLNNANSDHSRHVIFKAYWVINGRLMDSTLMNLVSEPYKINPGKSVIAFSDNSSSQRGFRVMTIIPENPGECSRFVLAEKDYDIIFTAETHNFPTGIAPFPGAATGTGGRIRDIQATGQAGLMIAGTAGYCVGALHLTGYDLPWENKKEKHPANLALPRDILIHGSNGCSRYGNEIGEPVINGFVRSADFRTPDKRRWAFLKPILFTGGIGQIEHRHSEKQEAKPGMLIVQIGGPAYRIGVGGGAASSKMQGENSAQVDFNAVQRGNAEMQQKMNRVVRACSELGDRNPIISIHDQGAGGPANVLKELVEKSGGTINMRKIKVGDPTMAVHEIWVAEYQERNGLLIREADLADFQRICERERVNCEVLGHVTGDGIFTVIDSRDGSKPVELELDHVLGGLPQKTFTDDDVNLKLKPIKITDGLNISSAVNRVLRLPSCGSKRYLASKVDRHVTGLIARQQCCGINQVTVADCGIVAQSHFGLTGAATAIGEQPLMMLVDPEAAARRVIAEACTNIASARITDPADIDFSGNWMWAPKLPGEGAAIYQAASAARDFLVQLKQRITGGKDSSSMATMVGDEKVISLRQLVMSAYCTMRDITKHVTPDLKRPGESYLVYIDLGRGQYRLGGSALAQVTGQLGNDCPDVDPEELANFLMAVMELHDQNLMLAYHDRSDDGLITTLIEMAIAGDCGLEAALYGEVSVWNKLFAGEAGAVIEVAVQDVNKVLSILETHNLNHSIAGQTRARKRIGIYYNNCEVFRRKTNKAWRVWEMTSRHLEYLQTDRACVDEEYRNLGRRPVARETISFWPMRQLPVFETKHKVAILREEGSNGDREMTSSFFRVGFENSGFDVVDVHMADLLSGKATLDDFRGLIGVGGFSYADDPSSAKGWASVIRFHPELKAMFDRFMTRPDTFSLWVCNGFQLATLMGWLPLPGLLSDEEQPRLVANRSGRFESRWVKVGIDNSPAIMLRRMEYSRLGVWVAHGEGRLRFTNEQQMRYIISRGLAPIRYVGGGGYTTEDYPANPNGSPNGIAALCTPDGRHLGMMPHPERSFLQWQIPYWENHWHWNNSAFGPWSLMFYNARQWCDEYDRGLHAPNSSQPIC